MALGTFHFPYYGGGGPVEVEGNWNGAAVATRPVPHTVHLAGVDYAVELRSPEERQLYRERSLDRQSQSVVQTGQADDTQFNSEGAWQRYGTSWHQGMGQTTQDFGDSPLPYRFADSLGIDVWDEWCAKLLPATEQVHAATASTQLVVATGQLVYHSDGTSVYYSSDLTTWTAVTSLAGTVQAMTTDGSNIYIATTSHIYTRADSAGTAAVSTFTADGGSYDNVAFVGNRLLAGVANVLYEIDSAGARSAFETHFQAAFRWTAIFSVGSRIYLGGYAGNRTEIYTATVDSSGVLVRSAEAAPFPHGELLRTAVSYGGVVLLCTNLGVRLATLSGDGALTYGALLDDVGDCYDAAVEGEYAWVAWDGMLSGGSGVGRLALDEFVNPLQPAYARDVYTEDVADTVTGVARFGGKTLFAVSGDGLYASTPGAYVTSGYLTSGRVYLGTIEQKVLQSLAFRTEQLDANTTLTVDVYDERDVSLGSFTATGANVYGLDASLIQTSDDKSQVLWATIKFTLSGNGSSSPCAQSWRLRGHPVIPLTTEWLVPLIIHKHVIVNDAEGQIRSYDQQAEVDRLVDIAESGAIVPYRVGDRSYRVRIDQYEWNPGEWDDTSDSFDGIFVARLLSA